MGSVKPMSETYEEKAGAILAGLFTGDTNPAIAEARLARLEAEEAARLQQQRWQCFKREWAWLWPDSEVTK